jgi:hypothetical protein
LRARLQRARTNRGTARTDARHARQATVVRGARANGRRRGASLGTMHARWERFDHGADIGVRGYGASRAICWRGQGSRRQRCSRDALNNYHCPVVDQRWRLS